MSNRLLLLVFAACTSLCAQSDFATLSGRVQDSAQTSISGARVTVTAQATATVWQTVTNSEGLFEVPSLLPSEYSLMVHAFGFADQSRDIVLEVGQDMGFDRTDGQGSGGRREYPVGSCHRTAGGEAGSGYQNRAQD